VSLLAGCCVEDSRYPLHARALERHVAWARDFAAVGDLRLAIGELRDIACIATELRDTAEDAAVEPAA
jgi:hypothetical protein